MHKGTVYRQKVTSHCNVGDLVQFRVNGSVYKTALVTKRLNNITVFIRYNVGEDTREIRMIEKHLYILNKNYTPNV
jgi:hypothetical protein